MFLFERSPLILQAANFLLATLKYFIALPFMDKSNHNKCQNKTIGYSLHLEIQVLIHVSKTTMEL